MSINTGTASFSGRKKTTRVPKYITDVETPTVSHIFEYAIWAIATTEINETQAET